MKKHADTYKPRQATIDATIEVLEVSIAREGGWNDEAIESRIKFMQKALETGMVRPYYVYTAEETIKNLQRQL
jgi:hypothetical protein